MNIRIPLPPAWLLSNVVVLAVVGGFLWLDKVETHWVIPPEGATVAQVDQLHRDLDNLGNDLNSMDDRLRKSSVQTTKWQLVDDPELALARLSASVAVLSLIQSKGGQQSAGSPQGKACVDYFLKGTGSFVECGFSRVP